MRTQSRRPSAAIILLSALSALALFTSTALAASGTLPAGTGISVAITSPADGTVIDVPAGTSVHPLTGSATASVAEGVDAPDTGIIYVIDLSASTTEGGPIGCGGNQNPVRDTHVNSILDCEIAALRALNSDAIAAGTVSTVGLVGFGSFAAAADLSPASGVQRLVAPDQDLGAPGNDVEFVLSHVEITRINEFSPSYVAQATNFEAAVSTACTTAGGLTEPNRLVVMLSDGMATTGGDALDDATACGAVGIDVVTFAVGSGANCANTGGGRGSLQQIAAATSNGCTQVDDVADLPDLLRDLVGSTLDDFTVNGTTVGSGYPADGPVTRTEPFTVPLVGGPNTITATAEGTDRDGSGMVSERITVHLNRIPVASVGDVTVPEGTTASLTALTADDDGDTLTVGWDLDADGFFDDATGTTASLPTTDGPASLPVAVEVCDATSCGTGTATVTVTNVAPNVDAGPDQTVGRNALVTLSGSFTDPAGAADEGYAWDFGGLASGSAAHGATLAASTSFPLEGLYTIQLDVTDDDGDTGSDTVTIEVVNAAPDCTTVVPDVPTLWSPDHTLQTITLSGATDAEGDTLTTTIVSVFQDEPVDDLGDGSTAPDAVINGDGTVDVRAERAGTGDGRWYHIAYTVEDGHGGSCSGVANVTVPKSQGANGHAVDQGPLFDSTMS